MPIGVAVIDANLLVPIVACDFLLTAFDHGLFEPIVSATVLDEVEHTLIDTFPHADPAGLRRRVQYMRVALADQTVEATSFRRWQRSSAFIFRRWPRHGSLDSATSRTSASTTEEVAAPARERVAPL